REEISTNIGQYLKKDKLSSLGVITKILVSTKDGEILFPSYYKKGQIDFDLKSQFDDYNNESINYVKIAEKNFKILKNGLRVLVDIKVKQNTWFTNSILILYLSISTIILYWYYKRRVKEWLSKKENEEIHIDILSKKLSESEQFLQKISRKEKSYIERIQNLRKDKEDLKFDIAMLEDKVKLEKKKSLDTNEILEEMEKLEEQVNENLALKEDKEREIAELKEEISQSKKIGEQGIKRRAKDIDSTKKRFSAIYKNVVFNKKAIEGFIALGQNFQIKAEETIYSLNNDSFVNIKRKVFSKKGKLNTFEVTFSYSGRVYFKKLDNKKIEIVAIGTKNTQEQDITFIESIS
ncbi:MAG: hypothetical protein U9R17_14080, partial [Thermodesulfobacteriota bacterium]|nr:hypothetical protein [Thermodesulfobacteriota bacterium]